MARKSPTLPDMMKRCVSFERRHLLAATLLLALAIPAARAADDRVVAVVPFLNVGGDPADDWIGTGIAETVSTDIRETTDVRVIGPDSVAAAFANGEGWALALASEDDTLAVARELAARG